MKMHRGGSLSSHLDMGEASKPKFNSRGLSARRGFRFPPAGLPMSQLAGDDGRVLRRVSLPRHNGLFADSELIAERAIAFTANLD